MEENYKFLDYDGLKGLVKCIMAEMPKADGTTIVKNDDGSFSATSGYATSVDTESETLKFSSSKTE